MANNFSSDSNCKALWRFENGALTTDSKGTNTLTNNNTVVADTVNFKEGAASADFEAGSSQSFSITDVNLNAGFPLKNGDTDKVISVCCWFRLESLPATSNRMTLCAKWDTTNVKRSFAFRVFNNAGNTVVDLSLGYNGGVSTELLYHSSALSINTWYHATITYNNADKG